MVCDLRVHWGVGYVTRGNLFYAGLQVWVFCSFAFLGLGFLDFLFLEFLVMISGLWLLVQMLITLIVGFRVCVGNLTFRLMGWCNAEVWVFVIGYLCLCVVLWVLGLGVVLCCGLDLRISIFGGCFIVDFVGFARCDLIFDACGIRGWRCIFWFSGCFDTFGFLILMLFCLR